MLTALAGQAGPLGTQRVFLKKLHPRAPWRVVSIYKAQRRASSLRQERTAGRSVVSAGTEQTPSKGQTGQDDESLRMPWTPLLIQLHRAPSKAPGRQQTALSRIKDFGVRSNPSFPLRTCSNRFSVSLSFLAWKMKVITTPT